MSVVDQGADVVIAEPAPPLEGVELDEEAVAGQPARQPGKSPA